MGSCLFLWSCDKKRYNKKDLREKKGKKREGLVMTNVHNIQNCLGGSFWSTSEVREDNLII